MSRTRPARPVIRLRPGEPDVDREPDAWLLPGSGPRAWLTELSRWNVDLRRARLWVVPRAADDPAPAGVLCPRPPGGRPTPSPRARPYVRLGERLFLPLGARPDPPLTPAQADELPGHAVLLRPGRSPVVLEAEDAVVPADLLRPPRREETDWDAARPGIAEGPLLEEVLPETPGAEEVLRRGAGGIGERSTEDLPAPGEAPDPDRLETARRTLGRGLARFLLWLTGLAPGGAPRPTWIDRVRAWATDRLRHWGGDLEEPRRAEIDRLLRLLESDPDEGLSYAIPVGESGAGRGTAPPSAELPSRPVDFDLDRVGGGQPVDPWSVPDEVRRRLAERYRALANRELALGRPRRAAFILGELLGDLEGAAGALRRGGHHREAAVIYREHLDRPRAAADCLEAGGHLAEAIPLHEEAGQFEAAGSLYRRLGREEAAVRAFREAAARARERGDHLAAARLLEDEAGRPEEALEVLASAWPGTDQAGACLRERIALLGRLGRHEHTTRLLEDLSLADAEAWGVTTELARALAGTAGSYPDRSVRRRAADATRVVCGRRLARADLDETRDLVRALTRLDPGDRLLRRDAARWLERARSDRPATARSTGTTWRVEHQGSACLPDDVAWATGTVVRGRIYAAGYADGHPVCVRASWPTPVRFRRVEWEQVPWQGQADDDLRPLLLRPGPRDGLPVLLYRLLTPGMGLEPRPFPATTELPEVERVGRPAWLPDMVVGLAWGGPGSVWCLEAAREPVVSCRSPSGELLGTWELGDVPFEGEVWPVPLLARRNHLYIGLDGLVVVLTRGGRVQRMELPGPVRSLCGASPYQRPRVVATLDEGGVCMWGGLHWGRTRTFGEDLLEPRATFTPDGRLVAVTAEEGRVWDTRSLDLVPRTSFDWTLPAGPPMAVAAGTRPGEFTVFDVTGEVHRYLIEGD